MTANLERDTLTVLLPEQVDSGNAAAFEEELQQMVSAHAHRKLELDASRLFYISSAGLRALLKVQKGESDRVSLLHVSKNVYEIFDVTGFTTLMDVQADEYRRISLEGCREIGRGFTGAVYQMDADRIVKVYYPHTPLDKIKNEHNQARKLFLLGVPTAIPYDIVRVNDWYGTVFEMVDASSLEDALKQKPEALASYAFKYGQCARSLHAVKAQEGEFSSLSSSMADKLEAIGPFLRPGEAEQLRELMDALPEVRSIVHGDLNPGNILLQKGEPILIDIATAAIGHPLYDITQPYVFSMFQSVVGEASKATEDDPEGEGFRKFLDGLSKRAMPLAQGEVLWNSFLKGYLACEDPKAFSRITELVRPYTMLNIMLSAASSTWMDDATRALTVNLGRMGLAACDRSVIRDIPASFLEEAEA